MITTTNSNIDGLEVAVEFEFDEGEPEVRYYPGRRGCCPNGDGHPGSPASVNILRVTLEKDGKELDIVDYLPDDIIEGLKEECLEEMQEQAKSAKEDRAERQWEAAHS